MIRNATLFQMDLHLHILLFLLRALRQAQFLECKLARRFFDFDNDLAYMYSAALKDGQMTH